MCIDAYTKFGVRQDLRKRVREVISKWQRKVEAVE